MDEKHISELADKLEELLKSGKLVGNEARTTSIIHMLKNDDFKPNQKGQFVAMAEKLISGERTANNNNYSVMIERLNTFLNEDYLDEETKSLIIKSVNIWKQSNMSDDEKNEWFKKAESLIETIREKKLLQEASYFLKNKKDYLGPEMIAELDNAVNAVSNAKPENKNNSITILEDILKQCRTILECDSHGRKE